MSNKPTQFSKIACTKCRQLHRKCEKSLPACAGCVQKGYACTYSKRKNPAKPLTFKDLTNTFHVNQREENLVRNHQIRKHTEMASETIIGYTNVMPFSKMQMLLKYNQDVCTNEETDLSPKHSEIALMFGVQGMSYSYFSHIVLSLGRMGHKQMAENLYRKTIALIHENNVELDFEVRIFTII